VENTFLTGLVSFFNQSPSPTQTPVAIPVMPKAAPKLVLEESPKIQPAPAAIPVSRGTPAGGMVAEKPAQFSVEAAPPNPPTTPNTVTGQVLDENKGIVEGAILEIRDSLGQPVRALKSNKLGHFIVVTPLLAGKYEVLTEKDGFEFEPVTFEAHGEIIPPIAITGKKVAGSM